MKPKPQFGRIAKQPQPARPAANSGGAMALNYDREERAAIHEFDGQLPRPEAEARAAEECQHCGQAAPLTRIWRESYGHGLDVCDGCMAALLPVGWVLGDGPKTGNLF